MRRPPRPPPEPIINREMQWGIAIQSVAITVTVLARLCLWTAPLPRPSGSHPRQWPLLLSQRRNSSELSPPAPSTTLSSPSASSPTPGYCWLPAVPFCSSRSGGVRPLPAVTLLHPRRRAPQERLAILLTDLDPFNRCRVDQAGTTPLACSRHNTLCDCPRFCLSLGHTGHDSAWHIRRDSGGIA